MTRDFEQVFAEHAHHFHNLQNIAKHTFEAWRGVGSYLMNGRDLSYEPAMLAKQELFFQAAKGKKHMLEIGVHAGHSLLIALLADDGLLIDCIDVCYWSHTEDCVQYLNDNFGNRVRLHKGDSEQMLPRVLHNKVYDFVHIDGDHRVEKIKTEYEILVDHIAKTNSVLIFDDIDSPGLREYVFNTFGHDSVVIPDCIWANALVNLQL
jgi:hypothetical protein